MALYNKYRPTDLDSVVGQEPVKRILRSQVDRQEISHSFLFVGPAGTGKTTVARILAAMLNDSSGVTLHPNLKDEKVERIFSGHSAVDVIEVDAASNGKVADAREIRSTAGYPPIDMRYKIWVIDECHAMSTDAWQAMLKVIEEPPEYAIFVFCTTEDDKVPETIKTRCTCLRFLALNANEIHQNLKTIVEKEEIPISDQALRMIAAGAKGSVRQAVKVLDHVASLGGEINPQDVTEVLGTPDRQNARRFVDSLARKDFLAALEASSVSISSGVLAEDFMSAVAEYCHDLMMCQSKSFSMENYGATPEEVKELRISRKALEEALVAGGGRSFVRLARKWIKTVNDAARLVVYKVQPQYQLDVLWVSMLDDMAQMRQ